MPGIFGLIANLPQREAESRLGRMSDSVATESFYSMGHWRDVKLGVYAGWVALRGTFSDGMPIENPTSDTVLVFSGEEFSARGEAEDRPFHALATDARSHILNAYEHDPQFPVNLNGWFHGLIADRLTERILLFNDRYGMHRLYFYEAPDAFYFAAEAKAILAVCPGLREIDLKSVAEYVSCGAVLENRTFFRDLEALPQGSAWRFHHGAVEEKRRYFAPSDWASLEALDMETFYHDLHVAFTRSMPRYFSDDECIGMSLTGGMDSRMILACRKPRPDSLPCYTFGSMFREHQDVRIGRQVAKMCGQPFHILTAGSDFLADFGAYAERVVYLTEGCADVSRAPDLYLNQRARGIAPIRMTGIYGGEVLRAVRIFKAAVPRPGLYAQEVMLEIEAAARRFESMPHRNPVSFAAFQLVPWMIYGTLAVEKTQLTLRSPFLDNDVVRTCFRAPTSALASNEITLRLIADEWKALLDVPTDRGLAGNQGRLRSAVSRAWLQFLFKAEYAYDMGMPQRMAKFNHAVSPLRMERLFLGRHKPFHFRVWYRDALKEYLQEVLLDSRSLSRSYMERGAVEAMVKGHLSGRCNHTNDLHKILTLELVHRLFIDGKASMEFGESQVKQGAVVN